MTAEDKDIRSLLQCTNPLDFVEVAKPTITVSPLGSRQNPNGGADAGPQTLETTTSGIQEALLYAGEDVNVLLFPGDYEIASGVVMSYGQSLEGAIAQAPRGDRLPLGFPSAAVIRAARGMNEDVLSVVARENVPEIQRPTGVSWSVRNLGLAGDGQTQSHRAGLSAFVGPGLVGNSRFFDLAVGVSVGEGTDVSVFDSTYWNVSIAAVHRRSSPKQSIADCSGSE